MKPPMCNLYSITTNQEAIRALFRVMNRYVGNLPPMPGVFPDYPAPVVRNAGDDRGLVLMRWGKPPPPRIGGPGDQYPQHLFAALARMVEARKPLPGAVQQLRRIRAGAEPGDQKEGRRLVRDQ
jgi:putative SOS response-associated peptidase YedK